VPLTITEREQLRSLRKAAQQVREASIIDAGQSITIKAVPGKQGYIDIYVQLLQSEPFRSLVLAVRLVYMKGEPAYFYSVCNVLHRGSEPTVQERVAEIRRQFRNALEDPERSLAVDLQGSTKMVRPIDVLETWVNGIAFHQDPERQEAVRELETTGARFAWNVQATVLQLAGRVLDLDDVVADFLGEARLPRI